ncbi:MAG: T9SS type A sorting domain-containing protein [bacterium]|nr:T9SS type A sorting domain-containing protein [bacterium]
MGKTNFLKKYFSLLIGILVSTELFASAPDTLCTRTYGGTGIDWGFLAQETQDSGFVIVGTTGSFGAGNYDVYLIKTDFSGDTLWTKTFGGIDDDLSRSIQQTFENGFIIAGQTESFGAGDVDCYLIKTDSLGNTLWTKTFGGTDADRGWSVQQISDSGFIIAGYTESFGAGAEDVYLIRTNSSGDTLWTKTFGGIDDDYGKSVQQTSDGGFVIAGYTYSFGADSGDVYLIKTNSSGDTLWTKTFGGVREDESYSVQETQDSGFILAGVTNSFGAGDIDVYLIKTDPLGDTLWTRTFGGDSIDYGLSVQQTSGGGFIIAGWTDSFGAGGSDIYLIRTNSSGDALWTKTVGGTDWDWGYSVQQTKNNGFIVAGVTNSFGAGGSDIYLIRLGKETGVEEKLNIKNQKLNIEIGENPTTNFANISYTIPSQCKVELNIYDITGSCVKTLFGGEKEAGDYSINLNAKELKAGIYFVRLTTGTLTVTKKITVIR